MKAVLLLALIFKLTFSNSQLVGSSSENILIDLEKSFIGLGMIPAKIVFHDGPFHYASEDGNIFLCQKKIETLKGSLSESDFRDIVSIIVFHEYAHILQFNLFEGWKIRSILTP